MCLKEDKEEAEQTPVEDRQSVTGTEGASSGVSELKVMTPDILMPSSGAGGGGDVIVAAAAELDLDEKCCVVVLVVRDMSSAPVTVPKETFSVDAATTTLAAFFGDVGKVFRYEANSFALTYQRSGSGEQVELNDISADQFLSAIGLTAGPAQRNNLILTDLHGAQPRKIEDDDLGLGASASPTSSSSSVLERKMWFDVSPSANSCDAAADASSSAGARVKQDVVGYVGLVNQAMTCYLNSLLQTLFMTPEFRNALYRWEFKGSEEEAVKNIPYQLQKLFLQLQTATRSAVETTSLTKSFGWDSSEVWQQHDIQELYRVMFDALEHCFKNTDQAELINDLYEGKMKDYVKCFECGTENAREDSFLDIPLPIKPFGSSTAYKSVEEALRAFVAPELLSGSNQYECSKCSAHCDAHKGLKFTRFPYLLTLHLKRFDFDYQTFHRIKLNDKVTFPNILDLNGFIEEACKEGEGPPEGPGAAAGASSPEKSPAVADKLDDASTTDSGSALDAEESSSLGFGASNQASNDTDIQEDEEEEEEDEADEGIDVRGSGGGAACPEKTRLLCASSRGPHAYELFSIMVHSGSASGGHYYAYIKDLQTGEWFCFNDQSVSRITYDDIRKTYGGANARGYYSSWTSSANAYMLMYRQADKERNVEIFSQEEFPLHIKELVQKMVTEEAAEREAREIERLMCKIKLFCQHPKMKVLLEKKFKVHKDITMKEATKLAYQELMLEGVVPLERCRLVKYEEMHDSIECSFDDQTSELICDVLGGVRSSYKFDLLMEIRDEDKAFQEYKPGGTTVKVYVVNLCTEEVEGPQTIRAPQTLTVKLFKELLGRTLSMDPDKMRIVQERYYNDHKPLSSDSKTLKEEGFYRSNKIYVEASGEEASHFFVGSQMYSILDRYEHTITLYCNLPERGADVLKELQIPPYLKEKEQTHCNQTTTQENDETENTTDKATAKDNVAIISCEDVRCARPPTTAAAPSSSSSALSPPSPPTTPSNETSSKKAKPPSSVASSGDLAAASGDDDDDGALTAGSSSAANSDQSASEDSSLTSDSDRTLVGEPPEDNLSDTSPDYHNVSSPEENHKEGNSDPMRFEKSEATEWGTPAHCAAPDTGWAHDEDRQTANRYFRAHMTEQDVLRVSVDKRITIGQLKIELQKFVGVSEEHFKLYKYYINSHEFECTRMTETLSSYGDNNVMKIRLGRALLPGEFKGKVFMLDPNNSEDPSKFLIDFVIRKNESVRKVKAAVVKEVNSKCGMSLDPTNLRLRKKSWKNPQSIFLDQQTFDDDIILYTNWEYYLQHIDGPEKKTNNPEEISIFLKRWRPSSYQTDPLCETIFATPTAEGLREKISKISSIPLKNVEFAKGKGTFPCDMSIFDIDEELDWSHKSGPLDKRPIYILDDGAVVYYRDKTEVAKTLTESERNSLTLAENCRLNRDHQTSAAATAASTSTVTTSRTREKGLKIYLNQS